MTEAKHQAGRAREAIWYYLQVFEEEREEQKCASVHPKVLQQQIPGGTDIAAARHWAPVNIKNYQPHRGALSMICLIVHLREDASQASRNESSRQEAEQEAEKEAEAEALNQRPVIGQYTTSVVRILWGRSV